MREVSVKPNQWRLSQDQEKESGMEMKMKMNKREEKVKPGRIY